MQLIGGIILHRGMIAEMKTGEGKTLVATLGGLPQRPVRQGRRTSSPSTTTWRGAIPSGWDGSTVFSGLTVGCIQHDMTDAQRQEAYGADITYGTNNEFGFDYLRDNMKFSLELDGAARPPLRHRR